MNIKGQQDPDPKSTPEEKAASEVQEEATGTPGEQAQKPEKEVKEAEPKESEEFTKLKSELGRFKQELGDARKEAEENKAYKLWYEQNARQPQQQQQHYDPNEAIKKLDEQWFESPTRTFQQMSNYNQQMLMQQTARLQAPIARQMAKMQHPEAFDGLTDAEIDQAMYGGAQAGVVSQSALLDPNAWVGAAWIVRGSKTGYKIPQQAVGSMNPAETEQPSRPSSSDEEIPSVKGDDLTETLIQHLMRTGITREQAMKEVQATKEMEGR